MYFVRRAICDRTCDTARSCFCRVSYGPSCSAFKSVGFKSGLILGSPLIISPPDGCRVLEGVATLASVGGGSCSTSWRREAWSWIGNRGGFRRRRYQSAETAFALPSGLFTIARISRVCLLAVRLALLLERDQEDLIIYAAESPFYTRLIARAGGQSVITPTERR